MVRLAWVALVNQIKASMRLEKLFFVVLILVYIFMVSDDRDLYLFFCMMPCVNALLDSRIWMEKMLYLVPNNKEMRKKYFLDTNYLLLLLYSVLMILLIGIGCVWLPHGLNAKFWRIWLLYGVLWDAISIPQAIPVELCRMRNQHKGRITIGFIGVVILGVVLMFMASLPIMGIYSFVIVVGVELYRRFLINHLEFDDYDDDRKHLLKKGSIKDGKRYAQLG